MNRYSVPTWKGTILSYDSIVLPVEKTVCEFYGVPLEQMRSHSRIPRIAFARQVMMYFCYLREGNASEVGRLLNRDHVTVLHGYKRVKGFCEVYPEIREQIKEINNRLTALPGSESSSPLAPRGFLVPRSLLGSSTIHS